MQLKLSAKIDSDISKTFYISLIVPTKQKSTVDTKKIMRKDSKHTTRENYQIAKEESRRRRK